MRPSGATSWMASLVSLVALSPNTRCKSPIWSEFKFHSPLLIRYPFDNSLPEGSPFITILLKGGIPSVPSTAIGKLTCSPSVASTIGGADRTGVGTDDGCTTELILSDSTVALLD